MSDALRLGTLVERGLSGLVPGLRGALPAALLSVGAQIALGQGLLLVVGALLEALLAHASRGAWAPLVTFTAASVLLSALELLGLLGVGAAVMRANQGFSPRPQDVLRAWSLGARGLAFVLVRAGLPVAALMAVVGLAAPEGLRAILGVLITLAGGLLLAGVSLFAYLRYALAWPALALEDEEVGVGLAAGRARARGRRGLLLGLFAVLFGASLALHAVIALLVPSPRLVGLSPAALQEALPLLLRAQAVLHAASGVAVLLVGAWAGACFSALHAAITAEG